MLHTEGQSQGEFAKERDTLNNSKLRGSQTTFLIPGIGNWAPADSELGSIASPREPVRVCFHGGRSTMARSLGSKGRDEEVSAAAVS